MVGGRPLATRAAERRQMSALKTGAVVRASGRCRVQRTEAGIRNSDRIPGAVVRVREGAVATSGSFRKER